MSEKILPREKALTYGFSCLDNDELLALILKSAYKDKNVFALAKELLYRAGDFKNLPSLSYDELVSIKGIKKAKALEILAILEIAKRLSTVDCVCEDKKLNPLMLIDYLRFNLGFSDQEEFYVVFLNGAGKIIKAESMFKGTGDKSLVGIDEILRRALFIKARLLVVAHNHPSDNCYPSSSDITLTENLAKGCKHVGITLLDHLIVSRSSYYSFKKAGLLLE